MATTPNRKRKPSCHHNLADKPDFDSLDFGSSDAGKKTLTPGMISKINPIILVLGMILFLEGIAMTAILCGFNGRIDIKLGLDGVQVVIDGRKTALLPPITDKTADTK